MDAHAALSWRTVAVAANLAIMGFVAAWALTPMVYDGFCDNSITQHAGLTVGSEPSLLRLPVDELHLHTSELLMRNVLMVRNGSCAQSRYCRGATLESLEDDALQLMSGGTAAPCGLQLPAGEPCSVTAVYYAALLLDELDLAAHARQEHKTSVEQALGYLIRCKNVSGGIGDMPGTAPSVRATYFAVRAAHLLLESGTNEVDRVAARVYKTLEANADLFVGQVLVREGGCVDRPVMSGDDFLHKHASTEATVQALMLLQVIEPQPDVDLQGLALSAHTWLQGVCTRDGVLSGLDGAPSDQVR